MTMGTAEQVVKALGGTCCWQFGTGYTSESDKTATALN